MSTAMEALVSEIVARVTREVLARIEIPPCECAPTMPVGVLTTEAAATYCGLASAQSMYNLISQGKGPKRFKRGRLNAFYVSDLDDWNRKRLAPGVQTPT
ncbi:MAG: helix-turn-helix transcriptional regulator [Microbacterium sp.]